MFDALEKMMKKRKSPYDAGGSPKSKTTDDWNVPG